MNSEKPNNVPNNDNDTANNEETASADNAENLDAAQDSASNPSASSETDADAETGPGTQPEDVLGKLEAEVAVLKDKLLRQAAEMQNLRKRTEREVQEAARYGLAPFAKDLLGVADNLSRAMEAVPDDQREQPAVKSLVDGVAMTERELLAVFEKHAIKKVSPVGETFDPNFHQAVAEVPSPDAKPGTVINVVQAGYLVSDRLVRPAMVVVAKAGENTPPTEQTGNSETNNENTDKTDPDAAAPSPPGQTFDQSV